MAYWHSCLTLALCSLFLQPAISASHGDKLIVILLDGFRPDYWSKHGLTSDGFRRILKHGAHAVAMTPDFPSSSYPNYYTLMTGLHTESHGMTGNFMYDVATGEAFVIGSNAASKLPKWWNKAEPLWITAETQGKSAYLYNWPGCDVVIRNKSPRFCKPYPGSAPTLADLDWAISDGVTQIRNETADIVGIYVELSDKEGHAFGPNSSNVQSAIVALDLRIATLLQRLRAENLGNRVNVVIFSDHGMVGTTQEYNAVNVSLYVNDADILAEINEGTLVSYWPKPTAAAQVYQALKKVPHADAYLKDEIPERYHYKSGPFVPPLVLVPRQPFVTVSNKYPWPINHYTNKPYVGFHGYDPVYREMKASFGAIGPAFLRGATAKYLHSVDVYQLLCALSGIKPLPNNGTWRAVAKLTHFNKHYPKHHHWTLPLS